MAALLVITLPAHAQTERLCMGARAVYAASGQQGSIYQYKLDQQYAGNIIQTHNDSIIVEWGNNKGIFQLGVREISQYGCEGNWAFVNVEVVGEHATFAQPAYGICGNGGVTVEFNKSDFKAFRWADNSVSDNGYITVPGRYELITIDQDNCRLSSFIDVVKNPDINISLGADTMICTPGFTLYAANTQANPTGTVYTWSTGETGVNARYITVPDHDMNSNSKYWVRAEHNGCVVTDTITVRACKITPVPETSNISNTITPNNDGENDVWNIPALAEYPDCVVEIFDRWGRRVFASARGYAVPWDGRDANGRYLPMETYYYIIHLNDGKPRQPVLGTVTIIR